MPYTELDGTSVEKVHANKTTQQGGGLSSQIRGTWAG